RLRLRLDLDVPLDQLVAEAVVLRRGVGLELVVGFGLADDLVADDRDLGDLALVQHFDEPAEQNGAIARMELSRKVPDQHGDDDEHHPEQQALERRIQTSASWRRSLLGYHETGSRPPLFGSSPTLPVPVRVRRSRGQPEYPLDPFDTLPGQIDHLRDG